MKYYIISLVLLLFSCVDQTKKITNSSQEQNKNIDTAKITKSKQNLIQNIEKDKKAIWDLVAQSILNDNCNKIIDYFKFPLNNEFNVLTEVINKQTTSITKKDFSDNYHRFFNMDFKNSLKTQSYKDITSYTENDTIWYVLGVGREFENTEGAIILKFHKIQNDYILKGIYGIGANFYYVDKKKSSDNSALEIGSYVSLRRKYLLHLK